MKEHKIQKILCMIFMLIMVVVFFILAKDVLTNGNSYSITILYESDEFSLLAKKIMLFLFLGLTLCIPVYFAENNWIPYVYCAIILIGTIVGGYTFWGYLLVVLSFFGMIFGAIGEAIGFVIRLFFSDFGGIWLVRVMQIIGHIATIGILCAPGEFFKSGPKTEEQIRREHEREKLDTLKDIDYQLKKSNWNKK